MSAKNVLKVIKDKEIDYSQPTTLEDLNSRIELLQNIKNH